MSDSTANPIPLTAIRASMQSPSQEEAMALGPAALPARPPSTFHRFGDLPQEIRHMIWEAAKPGPRIVQARQRNFKGGLCTRVWSDKPNDTAGNEEFFDEQRSPSQIQRAVTRQMEEEGKLRWMEDFAHVYYPMAFGPAPCRALKSYDNRLYGLFHACRESHEVVLRTHSLAFGAPGGYPEILFNFDTDTLYVGWDVILGTGAYQENFGHEANESNSEIHGTDRLLVKKLALSTVIPERTRPILLQLEEAEYICELLEWFGNIQELILVPEHFEDSDVSAELIWTDDSVTESHMYHYRQLFDRRNDKQWNLEDASRADLDSTDYNLLVAEISRLRSMEDESINWSMPQTYWKHITTPRLKAMFDEAMHAYNEERRLFHMRVQLVCDEEPMRYEPLYQVITHDTTVAQLVSEFRAKRKIPYYMKIEILGIQDDYSTPILQCENFFINEILYLKVTDAA